MLLQIEIIAIMSDNDDEDSSYGNDDDTNYDDDTDDDIDENNSTSSDVTTTLSELASLENRILATVKSPYATAIKGKKHNKKHNFPYTVAQKNKYSKGGC